MEGFTVTRGKRNAGFAENYRLEIKHYFGKGKKSYILKKVHCDRAKRAYGGAFYSFKFQTNQNIKMTGLSFYGPSDRNTADFHTWIEIFEPRKGQIFPDPSGLIFKQEQKIYDVKSEEMFPVQFTEILKIKKGLWYEVQFKLEGPTTYNFNIPHASQTVEIGKGQTVTFLFNDGARQAPQIHFTIEPPGRKRGYLTERAQLCEVKKHKKLRSINLLMWLLGNWGGNRSN